MTRIEFYVLPDANPTGRLRAACQLAAKGWQHGMQVFIRCVDEAQSSEIDELLWGFRAERFIPHEQHVDDPKAPVVIGVDQAPRSEEHTSELQSLMHNSYAVFCLKKKTNNKNRHTTTSIKDT